MKVLKPGVADVLDVDLTFLTSAAKVLEFLNPRFSRVSLVDVLSDIRKSMLEEVDFTKEAQNMKDFELYLKSQGIASATSPFVYTTASSKKVMTMERLKGAPLVDLKSIREITSEDPEAVLINALNVWLGSVLLAPSFHADVHAGNLLVLPDGRVGFIDFGIVGRISPVTFVSVEKFLQSIQLQNYDMMAKALVTMGATEYDRSENSKVSEVPARHRLPVPHFAVPFALSPRSGVVQWCGAVRCGAVWCGAVWCGVVVWWCGGVVVRYGPLPLPLPCLFRAHAF